MPKKQTRSEKIARAKRLGKAGYKAGKKAPAQDAKLLAMLKDHKIGDPLTLKLLDAWNKGFFEEHEKHSDKLLRKKGIITPRTKAKK